MTDEQKIEWVANTAAEEGDPDGMELGMRALEGDEHCRKECLELWTLWKGEQRTAPAPGFSMELVAVRDAATGEALEVIPGDPPMVVDNRLAGVPFTATFIGFKEGS